MASRAGGRYTALLMDGAESREIDREVEEPAELAGGARLPRHLWRDWLIVFVSALVLYVATCAPDVLMSDSGVYQLRVAAFPPTPAKAMPEGLVHVHPLYLGLAKVFTYLPVGNIAYRVNLASSFFGAVSVASIFVSVVLLTGSRWAAAIGAMSVGLGHTFWAYSVIAECLTLAAACLTAELLFLLLFAHTGHSRWYMAAALVNGLSISNHMMGTLATPVYAVVTIVWLVRGRLSWLEVLSALGLWLAGTSFYSYIILRALLDSASVASVIRSATTGPWAVTNTAISASLLARVAGFLALQYPTLLIVLAIVALWSRPVNDDAGPVKWVVFGVAVIHLVFAARFPVKDQYVFFVAPYACLGLLVGLGAWAVIKRWRWTRWAGLVLAIAPVGVYMVLPSAARRVGINPFTRELPYRDPYEFFLKPWQQGYYGVRRFTEETFSALPPNAVLFADTTVAAALLYVQQVEGKRADLTFIWAWERLPLEKLLYSTFALRWRRPVYLISTQKGYAPAALVRDCQIVQEGIVYRVMPPRRYPKTPWQ
ncbi:MAG: DUF2723 domain-containing protein [Phycisphaerae bacterium]|nr:DUF2723 domain-containing protein [Phycisphaerae bacterium]